MDENEGLELAGDGESSASSSSQSVRKNISLKLKQSPAKRGRGKKGGRGGRASKATKKKQEPEPEEREELADDYDGPSLSSLRPAGPPEPMHQNKHLKWDHKVNLIGEKMVDPLIHCCEKCSFPILVYGRMIPCKHVFCMNCAKTIEKNCARCSEQVHRIEQSAVGSVFMCTYGGSKNGVSGCRRTYLSPRDLQAHIKHRHLKEGAPPPVPAPAEYKTRSAVAGSHPDMLLPKKGVPGQLSDPALFQPRPADGLILGHGVPGQVSTSAVPGAPGQILASSAGPESYRTIPVMSTSRGNLITVPIQDERREGPPTEFVAGTFPTHIQQQPPPGPNPYPQGPPPAMFPAGSHAPVPISAPPPFSASNPPPPLNHPPRQPPLGSNAPAMSHPSSRVGVPQPHYSTSRPPFEGSPTFSPSGGHSPRPPWSAQGTGPQHRGPPPPGQNVPPQGPPIQGPPPQGPSYY